jgi:hypothetical protein
MKEHDKAGCTCPSIIPLRLGLKPSINRISLPPPIPIERESGLLHAEPQRRGFYFCSLLTAKRSPLIIQYQQNIHWSTSRWRKLQQRLFPWTMEGVPLFSVNR